MSDSISFTVLGRPAPQGSLRPFRNKATGKLGVKCENKNTMPFRQEVGWAALRALEGREQPFCAKHEPVWVRLVFYFLKPASAKKSRTRPVTKPDLDKLQRSCFDAMTGIMWHDDAQIVNVLAEKRFSSTERVEITVRKQGL